MNAVRSEMRRAREAQSMTFDVLAKRCATLGYEISRVVLSKIEGGYRPDVTLPELLVIARALNVGPAQLVIEVHRGVDEGGLDQGRRG